MKHPNGADEYFGGQFDVVSPCGWHAEWSDSDDDVEAKKKELRRLFTGSDDPNVKTILAMHPDDVLLEED
jgi:ABC-type Fe3+-hydroxamate transport system substrate-binding protein